MQLSAGVGRTSRMSWLRKRKETVSKETVRCSFCNKIDDEVRKLIAGPEAFICDECVEVCVDIVNDGRGPLRLSQPLVLLPVTTNGGPCRLCSLPTVLEDGVFVENLGLFCRNCAERVQESLAARVEGQS